MGLNGFRSQGSGDIHGLHKENAPNPPPPFSFFSFFPPSLLSLAFIPLFIIASEDDDDEIASLLFTIEVPPLTETPLPPTLLLEAAMGEVAEEGCLLSIF